jgi:hypothetical protein
MRSKRAISWGLAATALGLAALGSPALAGVVNLATGYSGGVLAASGDQPDDNWTVANAPNYKAAPVAYTVFPNNADSGACCGWVANGPGSDWIAADPDTVANGNATYTFTFDLTAAEAASASITGGQWTIDDAGTLTLNGHVLSTLSGGSWTSLNPFTAASSDFVAGRNTLVMQTTNADDFIDAARLQGDVVYAVPEPATWAMLILGVGMIGAVARRRREGLFIAA